MYKLFFDGASKNNQNKKLRRAGYGFIIYDNKDNEIYKKSTFIGNETNNVAEYLGLYNGLKKCKKLNIKNVNVYGDSKLIVNQINGIYKVKNKRLKEIHEDCLKIIIFFDNFHINHIYRNKNKVADNLANISLINK